MGATGELGILRLGPFVIFPADRRVEVGACDIGLDPAQVDLLVDFVRKPGAVLEGADLLPRVCALNVSLASYGEGRYYLIEVDRGFVLITPERDTAGTLRHAPLHNLPLRAQPIIGRDRALQEVRAGIRTARLLTIVGGGGVGKTTLALAAAEAELGHFPDGVKLLELASITDPVRVVPSLAALLDVRPSEGEPMQAIAEALAASDMLLVLDNCEHVVEEAARVAQALLAATGRLHLLATSREALEVPGELVYRLPPLELPPDVLARSWPEALHYSAVQLFVEQAKRADPGFRTESVDPCALIELCRRLDGLPLAIELMAAWVDFYGVEGLLREFDTRLMQLSNLSRPAQASHRSLEALVDWSHAQLNEAEQATFRRISVFRRAFGFDSAFAVAVDGRIDQSSVLNHLVRLAAKTLLSIEVSAGRPTYRLPECHRAYAMDRLSRDPEHREVRRRHAVLIAKMFEAAAADREALSRSAFLASYGPLALDVGAALEWAFSPEGDPMLGIELTASSLHLGLDLSMVNEYRAIVENVLTAPRTRNIVSPALELQFNLALGGTIAITEGPGPAMDAAVRKLRALSKRRASDEMHWKSLYGMWLGAFAEGQYATANDLAVRLQQHASSEGTRRESRRMMAQSRHHLGDHAHARWLAEALLSEPPSSVSSVLGGVDHKVSMRIVLARIEWLEGRPELARHLAEEAVALATPGVGQALCQALSMAAFPIAWWCGDATQAQRFSRVLRGHAGRHALAYYVEWASLFDAALERMRPSVGEGSSASVCASALDTVQRDMWWSLVGIDHAADRDAAVERMTSGETGWNVPDLDRACVMSSLANAPGEPGRELDAAAALERAVSLARAQGAPAWELRCAPILASLWARQNRSEDARSLLHRSLAAYSDAPTLPDVLRCREVMARLDADDHGGDESP